jgi:hypothetical protein
MAPLGENSAVRRAIDQLRIHDPRMTFPMHHLNDWLWQDGDLNRLIPALSPYIGQCGSARASYI